MRVSKEEFVKRILPLFLEPKPIHNDPLSAKPEELLEDDYDMIREAGLIILDETELRKRLKRLESIRAGSVYSKEQEDGMKMILREILGEASEG